MEQKGKSMKQSYKAFLILLFFFPSLACGAFVTDSVRGSGKIVTQSVDVRGFERVSLNGVGDVYIEQGDTESLTIETDDNILPLLETTVRGRELVLSVEPNRDINPSRSIIYRLTVQDLNGVEVNGSGNFSIEQVQSKDMEITVRGSGDVNIKGLDADTLSINLSGSGNITVEELSVKTVDTDVKGSGDIKMDGNAETQTISVSGSGNYLAADLETISADVRVPGSADITVWVQDELKINMNGSGSVRYYGKPTVDQSGFGSGDISSLGKK
jgi:Protein of unknown function (DUF2807).